MEYTITISVEDLRVIAAALNELPYKHAAPVLGRLQNQVAVIDQKRAEADEPPGGSEPPRIIRVAPDDFDAR